MRAFGTICAALLFAATLATLLWLGAILEMVALAAGNAP